MGIQSLTQINVGDIILPEKGGNPLYVIRFEKVPDEDNPKEQIISNIIGYQVLEKSDYLPSGNAQEITSDDIKGSLNALGFVNPVVLVAKNQIARVSVSKDNYYADYFASATENFKTTIRNIHDDQHNDNARIVDIEAAEKAKIQDYSLFQQQVGGNGNEADQAVDHEEPARKYVKRKTAVGYQKTMYLEDAVKKDILSKKLYYAFIQEANNFTTLQDVFDALETDDLNRFAQKITHSPFSVNYAMPPEGNEEDYFLEIERREEALNEDVIVSEALNVSLTDAFNRRLICQKTYDILSQQEDVTNNSDTLYDAFVTIGAHAYHLEEFKNPVSGYKLGKNIRADLIADVENAYDKFAAEIKEKAFKGLVRDVRSAFFDHVRGDADLIIDKPDLSQSYSRAAKRQAKTETAEIAVKRPSQLKL